MNKYEKPILIEEELKLEDIIAVSGKTSTDTGKSVDIKGIKWGGE